MAGPLDGLKVIEMAGLGPAPFCAMMLADMGADVVRIERPGATSVTGTTGAYDVLSRNRRILKLNLKEGAAVESVLALVERADILIEGFRPGVMERLGLGPEICLSRRPSLVYGRMTGWGQTGPLAHAAGHDINYIALSGALHAIGRPGEPPVVPLNYVGDFGGGAMMLAFGVVCAAFEAKSSGKGQVVDAAMTDGAALLGAMTYGLRAFGSWSDEREANLLDGGAPFYDCYACADGKFISIGAIEPQFYAQLLALTGVEDPQFRKQWRQADWPELKRKFADLFATRRRAEWCALLEGTDVCFAPVLDMAEAPRHPHNAARATFVERDGVTQPAPAPRFSRTPAELGPTPSSPGQDGAAVLGDWGWSAASVEALRRAGVV